MTATTTEHLGPHTYRIRLRALEREAVQLRLEVAELRANRTELRRKLRSAQAQLERISDALHGLVPVGGAR